MTTQDTNKAAQAATEAQKTAQKAASQATDSLDAVPEAFRSAAEQAVSRGRENYDRARNAMEETVEMLEKSLDKAGQGAAAFNRKLIDITQSNVNSGFDLAKNMAGAKNAAQLFEIQTAFARKQFEAFAHQAQEIRDLSAKVATDTAEPVQAHVARSMKSLKLN